MSVKRSQSKNDGSLSVFEKLQRKELARQRKRGEVPSHHHALSTVQEEVAEYQKQVWKRRRSRDRLNMAHELVQVAARAQQAAEDLLSDKLDELFSEMDVD